MRSILIAMKIIQRMSLYTSNCFVTWSKSK